MLAATHDVSYVLIELGLVIVGLAVLARLASRWGFSAIPWYLLAGLDHIAFEVALADFANEKERLEALGLHVETAEHAWMHWRSLYVTDPEGNQVELVCYDESI